MTRNQNSDDPCLQTAAKHSKVQISNSDMWAADVFYHKTCYDRFDYFDRKIPKENPIAYGGSTKPVCRKRIRFDKKENCDTEKMLSFI